MDNLRTHLQYVVHARNEVPSTPKSIM